MRFFSTSHSLRSKSSARAPGSTESARWLWLPGLAAIAFALYLGENDLTIATGIWQFPLGALGMGTLLVCSLSPRLPFESFDAPGTAYLASIAYSFYLTHKLVIHFALGLCSSWNVVLTSFRAHLIVEALIYIGGSALFFAVERPFLQLRRHIAPRRGTSAR
jgi:peptidoglycan/LPS O-acetylase OafA/YrhL